MRRKIYYSGKKKKHTVESTQVNELGLIIYKSKQKQVDR